MNYELMIKNGVKELVELLVAGNYKTLESMNRIGCLTLEELEEAISQIGEKLTIPPESAYSKMDIFELDTPRKYSHEYSIDFNLWTNNCESDWTLSCDAVIDNNQKLIVSIYSIHVL